MPRGASPASRSIKADLLRSDHVNDLGQIENPYARIAEMIDTARFGETTEAHDGRVHRVTSVEWARILDALLRSAVRPRGRVTVGKQTHLLNDSVNFVLDQATSDDLKSIAKALKKLPSGCQLRVGDPNENAVLSDANLARRPPEQGMIFVNVTERAQANLEQRWRTAHRVRMYDWILFTLSFVFMCYFVYLLWDHGASYRSPFELIAEQLMQGLPQG